jgi:hypothetical protein
VFAANWTVPKIFSGDTQVTSSNTILVDGFIYYAGVTAGDSITLTNGVAADTARGVEFFKFIAPAANGYTPIQVGAGGMTIDLGIYIDETKTGGAFGVGLIYQTGR